MHSPHLVYQGRCWHQLLFQGDVLWLFESNGTDWHVERIEVEPESTLANQTVNSFCEKFPNVSLLNNTEGMTHWPSKQVLLVAGPVKALTMVRHQSQADSNLAEWASIFSRFGRTLWTTIAEIEWPVKLAALCFFSVILTGSIICWLSGLADTPARGLFDVNIMVTAADLREQDYPSQHVFISFLKLSGLLLTAAFTALLTNYLVRLRRRTSRK